jgi:DNA polymerase III subunit beta
MTAPVSAFEPQPVDTPTEPFAPPPLPDVTVLADRKDLTRRLKMLFKAAERNKNLPVLDYVLVQGDWMFATDLDIAMAAPFGIALPPETRFLFGRAVAKYLASDKDQFVGVQVTDDAKSVNVGQANFRAMVDPREFPPVPGFKEELTPPWATIKVRREEIEALLPSVSLDETRFNLSGVCFDFSQNALVSTDGHRLHRITFRDGVVTGGGKSKIVQRKALELMFAACPKKETIELVFRGNHFYGMAGEFRVAGPCIDGEFPDYQQVIPKDYASSVTFFRNDMLATLSRAKAFTTDRCRGVKLETVGNGIRVSCSNPDLGNFSEVVPMSLEPKGEKLLAGFNARYIVDVLECCTSGEVNVQHRDDSSPFVVTDGNFTGVVMPMRL